MIFQAEQVALNADDYVKLIKQSSALPNKLVCAKAGQEIMSPVISPLAYFTELMCLKGDKELRLCCMQIKKLQTVSLPHAQSNIDSREDLLSWYTG